MIITLTQEEMKWASAYGQARTTENQFRQDRKEYDPNNFNLSNLQSNKVACVAEMAVVKWMGLDEEVMRNERLDIWAGFVPESQYHLLKQPDILGTLEVRRANRRSNPIPIFKKDVAAKAIIMHAYVDYTQKSDGKIIPDNEVRLLGWADAEADWTTGNFPHWEKTGRTARVAAEKKPMDTITPEDIFKRAGVKL